MPRCALVPLHCVRYGHTDNHQLLCGTVLWAPRRGKHVSAEYPFVRSLTSRAQIAGRWQQWTPAARHTQDYRQYDVCYPVEGYLVLRERFAGFANATLQLGAVCISQSVPGLIPGTTLSQSYAPRQDCCGRLAVAVAHVPNAAHEAALPRDGPIKSVEARVSDEPRSGQFCNRVEDEGMHEAGYKGDDVA